MADAAAKTPAKKKKLSTPMMALYGVGGVLGLYLVYRLYENHLANAAATTAATTAAGTDPLTGQPYQAGVGSLAPGASTATVTPTPTTSSTDPFQAVDPAASVAGSTYAQALEDIQTQVDAISPTLAAIITPGSGVSVNVLGATGSGPAPDTPTVAAARTTLIDTVAKATGLSTDVAGQQVALYLEGKPLTNAGAVNSITNQIKAGNAPSTNGSTTLPTPVLAKGVTQSNAAHAGAPVTSSTALSNAEEVAKKDQGTAAEKQAQANVTRTKTILASQKK